MATISAEQGSDRRVSRLLAAAILAGLALASAAEAQTSTAPPPGGPPPAAELGPSQPPREAQRAIASLEYDLDRADSLLLEGETEAAKAQLDAAERRLAEVHAQHQNALPAGYVPLFVAEERLAALRRQVKTPP